MAKDDESKAGMALLRSNHALPKHKKLQKLLSEPANKKLLLVTESEYLRDNAKQMHIVDDELYFVNEMGRDFGINNNQAFIRDNIH